MSVVSVEILSSASTHDAVVGNMGLSRGSNFAVTCHNDVYNDKPIVSAPEHTGYAIKKVEEEWHSLETDYLQGIPLGDRKCEILEQFGLPCKHHLLRAFLSGTPIPRSLLHPRWWLQGPAILQLGWKPSYSEEEEEREQRTAVDNRDANPLPIAAEIEPHSRATQP